MKKVVWFCILLAVAGTAFAPGAVSSNGNTASSKTTERMPKVDGLSDSYGGAMNLDDYRPVDLSPSSKAVRAGPIQHGMPLIPYIPRPSPPNNPQYGSYP